MPVAILTAILPLVPDILKFILELQKRREGVTAPHPSSRILDTVEHITDSISTAHPDWSDDTKHSFAVDAIKTHLLKDNIQLTDSQLNLLIELAVIRNKVHLSARNVEVNG